MAVKDSNPDDDLEDVMQELLSNMSQLPSILGGLADAVKQMIDSISPLVTAVTNLFSAVTAATAIEEAHEKDGGTKATELLVTAVDKNTAALTKLTNIFEMLIRSAMARMNGGLTAITGGPKALTGVAPPNAPSPPGEAGGTGGGGLSGAIGGFSKALGVAAAAIGVFVVTVHLAEQAFNKMLGYVRLFNPGVVSLFQYALDNLGATIGRAFVPAIQVATQVIRQVTSMLVPVMNALQRIMSSFSESVGNSFVQVLELFTTMLMAVMPIIEFQLRGFATALQIAVALVVPPLRVFGEALTILGVILTSFLPTTNVMLNLNVAVQWVIRNMYVLSVQIMKLVGAMGAVNALIAHVESKLSAGDVAAQQPQIKTLDQIAKDLALAAAAAGGAAGGKEIGSEKEFWAKTLEEMKNTRDRGITLLQVVEQIRDAINRLIPGARGGNTPAPGTNGAGTGAGGITTEQVIDGLRGAIVGGGIGGLLGGPLGLITGGGAGGLIGGRK